MSKKILLWTLGDKNMTPTKEAVEKLRNILGQADSNPQETSHIVWGPDLTVKEIIIKE